jgi:3-hydroxymyristoyl/3-hydroxydecanoyl-(acyl carrier protein) dehydratase
MIETLQKEITSEMAFHSDSPWFSGHFPGNPILPGIAQLSIVFEAVRSAVKSEIQLLEFKRVKFKQTVKPDDRLEIKAIRDEKNDSTYSFMISVKGEIACSGVMITKSKFEK